MSFIVVGNCTPVFNMRHRKLNTLYKSFSFGNIAGCNISGIPAWLNNLWQKCSNCSRRKVRTLFAYPVVVAMTVHFSINQVSSCF